MSWQPIETAPQEEDILVVCFYDESEGNTEKEMFTARFCIDEHKWIPQFGDGEEGISPVYWQPLPEYP